MGEQIIPIKAQEVRMEPFPKPGERWKTAKGRMIEIYASWVPSDVERIHGIHVDGERPRTSSDVFYVNGHAVMGGDQLVERADSQNDLFAEA